MRIRHFMDNKHAGRDESILAVEEINSYNETEMSREINTQTISQNGFPARGKQCGGSDTFMLAEVNANGPLSTSTVDGPSAPTLCKGSISCIETGASYGAASGIEPTEFDFRPQNGRNEVELLCHRFAGIDDDDFVGPTSDSEPQGAERDDILMGACSSSCSSISDCGMATTGVNCASSSSRRTLGQIRESLEQKVKRLRAEKEAVDEKIRMAQEEEEIRTREKFKTRGKVIIQRKDRLRKLVKDLKGQLDDHSQRLQNAYSTLLLLQRTIFRSRSFCKNRRIKQRPRHAEAPF